MKRTSIEKPKKARLVMIGNGPVGFKFCEKYIKYRLARQYDLIVYGEEIHPAYDRINLTAFFSNKFVEELYLAPLSWYEKNEIVLKTGQRIALINKEEKWIKTESGAVENYDKLILATGSYPFVPPLKNLNLHGVFVYRCIEDMEAIQHFLKPGKKAVVIGGGILGLEAARALLHAGMNTTVIEMADHIMSKQIDAAGAEILEQLVKKLGLKIICGQSVTSLEGNGAIEQLTLKDGGTYSADLVVISAGIRPRDELAKACALSVDNAGGVVVNNYNLTSDQNIFAIGECARIEGKIWGLAAPCFEMAEIVASRLAKIYKVFTGNILFTRLKILETKVITFGDALGLTENCTSVFHRDEIEGIYKRLNISADGKFIIGGILVGQTSGYASLLQMTRNKIKITGQPSELIGTDTEFINYGISNLPDNMVICLCESVCKGTIVSAIREHRILRLDQLKSITQAGTGCESCTSLLEDFISESIKENETA